MVGKKGCGHRGAFSPSEARRIDHGKTKDQRKTPPCSPSARRCWSRKSAEGKTAGTPVALPPQRVIPPYPAPPKPDSLQRQSKSYILPVQDTDFLLRDELRGVRFALEYEKAELMLRDAGIRSTIVCYGSARIPSREQARERNAHGAQQVREAAWPAGGCINRSITNRRGNSAASFRCAAARSRATRACSTM